MTGHNSDATAADDAWLSGIKETIWLTRPDLRQLYGEDRARFETWLLLGGTHEYRALAEAGHRFPTALLSEPAPEALPGVQPVLTGLMKQIWTLRPDLQTNFDLGTQDGQQRFVWWYFTYGMSEMGLARFVTAEQKRFVNDPADDLDRSGDGALLPVTRLMRWLWLRHPFLQDAFPLDTPQSRATFVLWYFTTGLTQLRLEELVDDRQMQVLKRPVSGVPMAWAMLLSIDPDLQKRFGTIENPAFTQWATTEGPKTHPLIRLVAATDTPAAPAIRRPAELRPGINLIGYARGQFGIGEDVRMAARALQAAGVPFSIYNVEPGADVCQGDDSVEGLIADGLPYAVNMLCTTGIETARLAAVEGRRLFDGRRTIGYWPWELPEWPAVWRHAYDLVDEVWASSRYTYEAFTKSSPKPVRHMPMAVTVDATAGLTRRDFGLPENRLLFVFAFDTLSHLSRKNPLACVHAFQQAFPLGSEPVGLVVKAMRATPEQPVWQEVLAAAAADPRISIIDRTLSRGAVLDLYRVCDSFVSLHRAEGFGRNIAETMMLGKPAIATGFSGNMDFTTPGTAALVDHVVRPLAPGEYPFGDGLSWAEPDVGHAAWWMRRLAEDSWLRRRLADQGQALVTATYAPVTVGAVYAALFDRTFVRGRF
ncbi:glycosyltransferase (plasmid) [Azospirillum oryzae]|uniref:Glycosyltransferase n=1 Tax=Azospirillum oryzae TaxID=286727 RepID=A0A6N1ABV8_9PROT|nr:glycosyltransferase [Azospirillum oryzae]KAA0586588.1 glycosyltransferase [Azospirillum oryzae]QKS49033.1 glycosyltransferase [Azospirillum oryzae]GLR82646.1 hypothetical protein GCM10007856_53470 [Azospirillum oryzae]